MISMGESQVWSFVVYFYFYLGGGLHVMGYD